LQHITVAEFLRLPDVIRLKLPKSLDDIHATDERYYDPEEPDETDVEASFRNALTFTRSCTNCRRCYSPVLHAMVLNPGNISGAMKGTFRHRVRIIARLIVTSRPFYIIAWVSVIGGQILASILKISCQ
jgi:hypothetical protein